MKKILFTLALLGTIVFPNLGLAQTLNDAILPTVYLFHGEECPHCQAERKFLGELKKELPNLEVKEYEVWHNKDNLKILQEKMKELNFEANAVPITIIGKNHLVGFDKVETTGEEIRSLILKNSTSNGTTTNATSTSSTSTEIIDTDKKTFPILGEISLKEISLPLLTAVVGVLDGFNPCSMWALLTMITLILATGSKKKMWIVGWTFILVSGLSYFLFMTAWLNAFMFLSVVKVIRVVVGLIAVGAGVASLNDFFAKKYNVCLIGNIEQQQKITEKFNQIINANWVNLAIGVAGIAFSVNLIELMCSIGFPVIYTQALVLQDVAVWQKYLYIGFYVFFYMLLNIIVLLAAGFSSKFFVLEEKYTKYTHLIAGIAMLILGLIFIFKPELLSFK